MRVSLDVRHHVKIFTGIVLVALLWKPAISEELQPLDNETLAQAMAFRAELANSDGNGSFAHTVRIWVFPKIIGECWGKISTCPDWRIVFTLVTGDMYDEPRVFELPVAKGWEFVSWHSAPDLESGAFTVRTALPSANIDSAERASWSETKYKVVVSADSATVEIVPGDV